jgi:hypothetical protein
MDFMNINKRKEHIEMDVLYERGFLGVICPVHWDGFFFFCFILFYCFGLRLVEASGVLFAHYRAGNGYFGNTTELIEFLGSHRPPWTNGLAGTVRRFAMYDLLRRATV